MAAAAYPTFTVNSFARIAGLVVLTIGSVLAFVFAFAAMLVIGVMVLGAAIALRLMPGPRRPQADDVLEARRTPTGWVVEASATPKS